MKYLRRLSIIVVLTIIVAALAPTTAYLQGESPLPTPEPAPVETVEVEPPGEPAPEFPPLPEKLPGTAAEALEQLIVWVTALGGYVTYHLTRWLRKNLPMVGEESRSRIAGLTANLVAAGFAALVSVIVAYGTVGADFLDANGIWAVLKLVLGALGGAEGLFVLRKLAKARPSL
ncbi:MAG: hypothetical protein ACE5G8_06335 [Anaerolineae bacterium]